MIYLMLLITINKSIKISMFARESFLLVNYSLKDIIKLDRYRFKILKNLGKLMNEEFRLGNYKLSNDYCIMYLKLYKRVVSDYKGSRELNSSTSVKEDGNNMKEVKYLSPKYLDRVINTYTDCRKFLVGKLVYNLVEDINRSLPRKEQWEVFTSYSHIYETDGKYGDSNYRQELLTRQNKLVDKLVKQYQYLEQIKSAKLYSKILG